MQLKKFFLCTVKKSTQIGVILTAVYLCILPVLVVWHSYEHHHEHVHTNHDGPSVFEDVPSCDICDVTKHQKLILESNEDQNKELTYTSLDERASAQVIHTEKNSFHLRAPPKT